MATEYLYPNGGWSAPDDTMTASAGNKWECVDDPQGSPNDDTDYCYATGANYSQGFTVPAASELNGSATISNVRLYTRMRRITASSSAFYDRLLVNGVAYGSATRTATDAYSTYYTDYANNPATGLAWAAADLRSTTNTYSIDFIRCYSTGISGSEGHRLTQVYLDITYTQGTGGGRVPEGAGAGGGIGGRIGGGIGR